MQNIYPPKTWFILNLEILIAFSKRACSSSMRILRGAQWSWGIIAGSSHILIPSLLLIFYVMVPNWHWNLRFNRALVSFRSFPHHECSFSVPGSHPGMYITFSPCVSPVPSDMNSSSVVNFNLEENCRASIECPLVMGSDIFLIIISELCVWKKTTTGILYHCKVSNVWPQCCVINDISFCKARFADISNLKTSWLSYLLSEGKWPSLICIQCP